MSLDGYIADREGSVNWLTGHGKDDNRIDTVIMGWNTYHQIVTELSPETWPYPVF